MFRTGAGYSLKFDLLLKAAILGLAGPVIGSNGALLMGSGWIFENKLKKS
jgi:hypothetical protein